jgi:hypothetical protein
MSKGIIGSKVGELRDWINDGIVIKILRTKVLRMTSNAKD